MNFLIGFGSALIVAALGYRAKALALSGAIAAIIVGGSIFAFGGLSASMLLIFFFISGSALSRLNDHHAGSRTWKQVMANGFLPALSMTIMYINPASREEMTLLFLGSLAVATADTWATEIGIRYGGKVYDILTFKPMQRGLSGGVSLIGILASILGALSIALLSLIHLEAASGLCQLGFTPVPFVITLAGTVGALIDSIIGAGIQAKYMKVSGEIIEEPQPMSELVKGMKVVDNNLTNLIATCMGGILAIGIASWF